MTAPKELVRKLVSAALSSAADDLARQELQCKRKHIEVNRLQHEEWLRRDQEKVAELKAALDWVDSRA